MEETIYSIDIQKLFQFIFQDSETKNINESEMVDVFEPGDNNTLSLIQRQIRESKNSNNDNKVAIRYDILKMFIEIISDINDFNFEEMTPLQTIIFNTLLNQQIIVSNK